MIAIWDKDRPEMDWSLLEWKPRINDQQGIVNYQDPWEEYQTEYAVPLRYKHGHGKKVWVKAGDKITQYDSISQASKKVGDFHGYKAKMAILKNICKRRGYTCGFVNA